MFSMFQSTRAEKIEKLLTKQQEIVRFHEQQLIEARAKLIGLSSELKELKGNAKAPAVSSGDDRSPFHGDASYVQILN